MKPKLLKNHIASESSPLEFLGACPSSERTSLKNKKILCASI
jgi:hypothetical protein